MIQVEGIDTELTGHNAIQKHIATTKRNAQQPRLAEMLKTLTGEPKDWHEQLKKRESKAANPTSNTQQKGNENENIEEEMQSREWEEEQETQLQQGMDMEEETILGD
ncbi:hypothetical protein CYMTET_5169 [Cymbomonas tetramitiformis]|uniref:Uncharacterized protein n=1 Tax=Cymbomonas tetramitiformis TaxID=36881 RepID=A0AAE0GZY5_9CHLO|nr:hypothetical protein CYMTET_5169 [Cymbomonas tetramitiformis]